MAMNGVVYTKNMYHLLLYYPHQIHVNELVNENLPNNKG